MIATLIDSYNTEREEFQLTNGYQPCDSLFYLKKGSFSCEINGEERIVEAGDIALFDRRTLMKRHVIEPISFYYIKYSMLQEGTLDIRSHVSKNPSARAVEDLLQIERFSATRTNLATQLRSHYLNDLLLVLFDAPISADEKTAELILPTVLDAPIAFLRANMSKKVNLNEVAQACNLSVSSLESKFRALTGQSLYGYLIRLRMEEGMRLLSETSYSVTQIAERCGYENLFYFCNAFKKYTQMTPSEYRKNNLI